MNEAMDELPANLARQGCKLYKRINGNMIKYVLINENKKYRGFTHLRDLDYPNQHRSLVGLFNDYLYKTQSMRTQYV